MIGGGADLCPVIFKMQYLLIIIAAVVLDQIIKFSVVKTMELYESVPVIQDVFHLTYIHNTGAAFSMMEGMRILLILLPLTMVAAAIIYMFIKRKTGHPLMLASIALIAGGGLGNLIDRIFLGYVVDYLDFRVFPIFNLADICVCVGCGLLILYVLFIDGKQNDKRDDI